MDPVLFREITRRDMLDQVTCGIKAAMQYRDVPLKINCVPMGNGEAGPDGDRSIGKGLSRSRKIY